MAKANRYNTILAVIRALHDDDTAYGAFEVTCALQDINAEDAIDVLNRMADSFEKQKNRNGGETKAQKENRKILADAIKDAPHDTEAPIVSTEFAESFGISPRKASSVLRQGVSDGILRKSDTKKNTYYLV